MLGRSGDISNELPIPFDAKYLRRLVNDVVNHAHHLSYNPDHRVIWRTLQRHKTGLASQLID